MNKKARTGPAEREILASAERKKERKKERRKDRKKERKTERPG